MTTEEIVEQFNHHLPNYNIILTRKITYIVRKTDNICITNINKGYADELKVEDLLILLKRFTDKTEKKINILQKDVLKMIEVQTQTAKFVQIIKLKEKIKVYEKEKNDT